MLLTHKKLNKGPRQHSRSERIYLKWYQSKLWKGIRDLHKRQNPFCVECLPEVYTNCAPGKGGVADHVIPVKSGKTYEDQFNIFFYGELQTLCKRHHEIKSRSESKGN